MDSKKTVQTIFIFALLALFLTACIAMIYPFFTVILWATLLYIIFRPLHGKLILKLDSKKKFYKLKKNLIAGLFAVGILFIIIIPLIFISFLLLQELTAFFQNALSFIKNNPSYFSKDGPFGNIFNFFTSRGIDIPNFDLASIQNYLISFIQSYSSKFLSLGTSVVSKTGNFIISLLFVVFALFFFFLDGQYLIEVFKKALPVKNVYMDILTQKFAEITRKLFSGYILVALYQGVASFIIMTIFHVRGSLLFSVILMFASFIPIFGASIVWLPIGIVMCFTVSMFKGILFLLLCGFCVSFLDNFLRPFLLKDRINIHPLIIFFSILGGLKVFGMNGLILGPLVVILFFTVLDLLVNTKDMEL
ncbi:MAG: AI-2E family transporter [Treponema sp.]|nr:AI-2E family transporter [Candidatus Treponema merdequi]